MFILIIAYVSAIFYLAITTPISPHEAYIFYTSTDIVSIFMHWGSFVFSGTLGLRIFFIFFGFLSITLFYELSKRYFSERTDIYTATTIFMLLPGILTASTLANEAIMVLPLVIYFVLTYERKSFWSLPFVMLALFFIHESSIIFFVALLLYGLIHRDKKLSIFSAAFLIAFIYLAKGIEIGGGPSGHFVEIFGLYATVFSPLLFLYFFYAMYRILLREEKSLLWYISFTALAFSLLLSIRQRIHIADFAPYVMITIVLMLDVFRNSVRVRLPEFQKLYNRGFYIVLSFLGLSTAIIIFHQAFFLILDDNSKHFAKKVYEPYFLSVDLKSKGIDCYDAAHGREIYQLQYYNIYPCED